MVKNPRPNLVFRNHFQSKHSGLATTSPGIFKNINITPDVVWALSGGFATDLPDLKEDFRLANVSLTFRETLTPFYSYDGSASHIGLTWSELDSVSIHMTQPGTPLVTYGNQPKPKP
jgi:hypothetical protein